MSVRRLPVRPDLDQPKHQAKDLLRAIHAADPAAIRTTTRHDYRNVTALSWRRRFHSRIFVSEPAVRRIEGAGGVE